MHAETELCFPSFSQNIAELFHSNEPNNSTSNMVPSSALLQYAFGGEGDLFKAPDHIFGGDPFPDLDGMNEAAGSITPSGYYDTVSSQGFEVCNTEYMQNQTLFGDSFYGCRKGLTAQSAVAKPMCYSMLLDIQSPGINTVDSHDQNHKATFEGILLPKSASSSSLSSMHQWIKASLRPNFLEFQMMDYYSSVYGLERTFSKADIGTPSNGETTVGESQQGQPLFIRNDTCDERKQKLIRYRDKKTKRNFNRKIKYACRKALADSQSRVSGRFAKTDES